METEKCICLNSQTECQERTLHVLGIGNGDDVIVPAYTYTASASVIAHVGAKIVLVDSQSDCLEMDACGSCIAWLCTQTTVHAMEMPRKRYDIGNLESYESVQKEYKI